MSDRKIIKAVRKHMETRGLGHVIAWKINRDKNKITVHHTDELGELEKMVLDLSEIEQEIRELQYV